MEKKLLIPVFRIILTMFLMVFLISSGFGKVWGASPGSLIATGFQPGSMPSERLMIYQLIKGQVVDADGNPIPGATILVEGTTIGTATDMDGNFSLDVPDGAVLLVSFIGYSSLRIEVGNQSNLKISLMEDASALDEVVVVGYGTVERREMTGSIASIGRQEILSEPVYSFENLLQGRAAGVDVVADSYRPGAGSTVRIRG